MRYAVGIDLGTTNSALAWVDLDERPPRVRTDAIAQLVAPGDVARRPTLPSFLYLPGEHELPAGASRLPWTERGAPDPKAIVGELARAQGAQVPGHLVSSAKSWLCHPGVDRQAAILPWAAPPEVARLSPVDASAAYLRHLDAAFRADHGVGLAATDLVLTVPASFDEVAGERTVEAAARAGLERLVLLEEPQAAFYAWIEAQAESPEAQPNSIEPLLAAGATVLVCDLGGGTTDFSLIRCLGRAEGGAGAAGLRFERTAVGDHLLLGGDNMDLALARRVERALAARAGKLDAARFQALVQACRIAKEKLLGEGAPESWTIHVGGRGRSLVGGGGSVELTRAEAHEALVDGFFPIAPRDAE